MVGKDSATWQGENEVCKEGGVQIGECRENANVNDQLMNQCQSRESSAVDPYTWLTRAPLGSVEPSGSSPGWKVAGWVPSTVLCIMRASRPACVWIGRQGDVAFPTGDFGMWAQTGS